MSFEQYEVNESTYVDASLPDDPTFRAGMRTVMAATSLGAATQYIHSRRQGATFGVPYYILVRHVESQTYAVYGVGVTANYDPHYLGGLEDVEEGIDHDPASILDRQRENHSRQEELLNELEGTLTALPRLLSRGNQTKALRLVARLRTNMSKRQELYAQLRAIVDEEMKR